MEGLIRFETAGESHGKALVAILRGIPAGLQVTPGSVDEELARRQGGFGRGARMKIEQDRIVFLSGIRHGLTMGSPIAMTIENRDFKNWRDVMSPVPVSDSLDRGKVTRPRPGHADLAGALKYGLADMRNVVERASARETAARVAAGAIAKLLLKAISVEVASHTVSIGESTLPMSRYVSWRKVRSAAGRLRTVDTGMEEEMAKEITAARFEGDTLGGIFEVVAHTPPPGLGSSLSWDDRLDGRLAGAIMSIPAVKAVEIGMGVRAALLRGSEVHDAIGRRRRKLTHATNRAGGIEGGMTNGEEIRLRGFMKPLSSLRNGLPSVDLESGKSVSDSYQRSDVVAVPAAGVVAEAMTSLVLADAAVRKFGGDTLKEFRRSFRAYRATLGRGPASS